MSRIANLLRELADEIEQKEICEATTHSTINTRLDAQENITDKNVQKIKKVADAFATFANILGD